MTVNLDKTYFVKLFTFFGLMFAFVGYIAYYTKEGFFLLPLVIMSGTAYFAYFCMWIRSFFGKAIEQNEQFITVFFLFSKKRHPISSFLDVDFDKKQIYFLNDKGKKIRKF